MVWKTRITTVAMKPIPKVRATCLNSFLSIAMFLEIVDDEDRSSEVMSSIMAIAASHRPMSDIVRGSSMVYTSIMRYETSIVSVSRSVLVSWMVTGLPVVLAIAHAMALTSGEPRKRTLCKSAS